MRRLVVPVTLRFDRLHLTLQAPFGWTNSHLFEFFAGEVRWGIPGPHDDYGHQPLDASKARLCDIVQETGAKTIHYLYDFGDSRDHVIKLEKWFDNASTDGENMRLWGPEQFDPNVVDRKTLEAAVVTRSISTGTTRTMSDHAEHGRRANPQS
ncbi:hypothetical protein ACVINW_003698 [Bradyrhizobium sp. USDA 4461]